MFYRKSVSLGTAVSAFMMMAVASSQAAVTGNPQTDGWTSHGTSLDNGIYVRGDGNYSYDVYSTALTITANSGLEANAGANSWLVGDTVLGAGGIFSTTTASESGWGAFTGVGVNSLFSSSSGPKLQAKFGSAANSWSTSTVAPDAGNGLGSLSNDTKGVQIRTGTYYTPTGPAYVPNQDQAGTLGWDTNAGQLMSLAKSSYLSFSGGSGLSGNRDVARVIWTGTNNTGEPASWELLLNVTLLGRLNPLSTGLPGAGDPILLTVQDNDGKFTDAKVETVPEPGAVGVLGFCAIALLRRRRRA